MGAGRADARGLGAFVDVAAHAANPLHRIILLQERPVLDLLDEGAVAGLVVRLDGRDAVEQGRHVLETFRASPAENVYSLRACDSPTKAAIRFASVCDPLCSNPYLLVKRSSARLPQYRYG